MSTEKRGETINNMTKINVAGFEYDVINQSNDTIGDQQGKERDLLKKYFLDC